MNTQRPNTDHAEKDEQRPPSETRTRQSEQVEPQASEKRDDGGTSDRDATKDESKQSERVAQLESELASTKDRLLRALAAQDNITRRAQRDREEAVRYAHADLARDLLPIIDNLARALDSMPEEDVADESMLQLLRGVSAIERQMLQALTRHGIQRFNPLGESFDPHRHHAVYQNAATDQPAGTVTEVLQPGYLHHDRLLRPAMVGVAGEPDAQVSSSDAEERSHSPTRHH